MKYEGWIAIRNPLFVPGLELPDSCVVSEESHLLNCYLVQFPKAVSRCNLLLNEKRVQILQIGEANKLRHIGVISDVALVVRMAVAPIIKHIAQDTKNWNYRSSCYNTAPPEHNSYHNNPSMLTGMKDGS